ncbi:antitoxin VbhA family protein, partial [Cryobacterium sp. 10I5]|uniref:antitoxin VbhA family protein n=1 Tax=Cryobacterium sp. 10I5 TaxID=3048581 RepID=UPI002B232C4D
TTGALPHDQWGSTARSGGAQRLEYSLEGMEPDRETVEDISSYLEGSMTLEEFIEKSKAL